MIETRQRPKLPRHKQRDMSVRCRHKDGGIRAGDKAERRTFHMLWRDEQVNMIRREL